MIKEPKVQKCPLQAQISPLGGICASGGVKPPIKRYTFLKRQKNADYEAGLVRLDRVYPNEVKPEPVHKEAGIEIPPFESCLLTTKSDKKEGGKVTEIWVKTRPKWLTDLLGWNIDPETGEAVPSEVYQTNDFKVSNGKKIKALDSFCKHYQPLYRSRKVTLLFFTFTRANYSRIDWKQMTEIVSKYLKRLGYMVRGYVWTAEISNDMHYHFHLCVAIDRVQWKTIPESLKFEKIWGQRTEIEFVKKNVRHYMAKYFAKCEYRAIGKRSYGKSKKFL